MNICHEIRQYFLVLFFSEPQWLQVLFRAYDGDFEWDVTCGKSRAASFEAMEDQDKIEVDKINIIGDEGQGDAQNNNAILERYVPMNFIFFIFIRSVPSPPFFLLFF